MLHNTAKPRVTPRSQKSYRGANNHTAEPNFLPRSHNISTAELTPRRGAFLSLPRNQKSYRGTKYPTAEPFYIYRGTNTTARRICVPLGFSTFSFVFSISNFLILDLRLPVFALLTGSRFLTFQSFFNWGVNQHSCFTSSTIGQISQGEIFKK